MNSEWRLGFVYKSYVLAPKLRSNWLHSHTFTLRTPLVAFLLSCALYWMSSFFLVHFGKCENNWIVLLHCKKMKVRKEHHFHLDTDYRRKKYVAIRLISMIVNIFYCARGFTHMLTQSSRSIMCGKYIIFWRKEREREPEKERDIGTSCCGVDMN